MSGTLWLASAGVLAGVAAVAAGGAGYMAGDEDAGPALMERSPIATVWAGHPVGFCLLTDGDDQFVAFYDADRKMTVGRRRLPGGEWRLAQPDETLGWDSHNYVTMALDRDGYLHLSGNMHCSPLVYYRTAAQRDIGTFERVPAMVGDREDRCTYPEFMRGPVGELIFTYRDGQSGSGDQIYNVYDPDGRSWRRLIDGPLVTGEGRMNAYLEGPVRGPDGWFHLCWVWRDTPDCATNHDICYARSRDLVHWETSAGEPLATPITPETCEVIDPVPPGGGAINGNTRIGFDTQGRVIVSYHKFDDAGHTQIYNARREATGWVIYQASDWAERWDFSGGGSIPFRIGVGPVEAGDDGVLTQAFGHFAHGSGRWRLDEATLKPAEVLAPKRTLPPGLGEPVGEFPGLEVHVTPGEGASAEPGVRYWLRWETLGPNRDRPREAAPPPSSLEVLKVREG